MIRVTQLADVLVVDKGTEVIREAVTFQVAFQPTVVLNIY